jgi:hypothetical protein
MKDQVFHITDSLIVWKLHQSQRRWSIQRYEWPWRTGKTCLVRMWFWAVIFEYGKNVPIDISHFGEVAQ